MKMIADYSYIINTDIATKGDSVYDLKSHQVMIYDGKTWQYLSAVEEKFRKRKRIISKLLSEI